MLPKRRGQGHGGRTVVVHGDGIPVKPHRRIHQVRVPRRKHGKWSRVPRRNTNINERPVKPFLPPVIQTIVHRHSPHAVPSATAPTLSEEFEKTLNRTDPDSAASLQQDVIEPSQKKNKKKKKKSGTHMPKHPTTANATVIHFNINLGAIPATTHFLRKFVKRFEKQTLVISLVETGLQTEEEAKTLTNFAAELGLSSSHVFLLPEESNLILKLRKQKKNKLFNESKTPRRGGVSVFWNAPLREPVIVKT